MSINILDLLKDQIGGQLAGPASNFLGESESGVSKALDGIFPALLGKMVDGAGDDNMLGGMFDMIKGGNYDSLSNVAGLFGGGGSGTSGVMNMGGSLLNLLMGNKTGALIDMIAKFAGIKGSTTTTLLKLAAPFLMRTISKQISAGGLNLSSFKDLIMGQKSHVSAALPSGLGSLGLFGGAKEMGKDAIGKVGNTAGKVVDGAGDVVGKVGDTAGKVVGGAADLAGDVGGAAVKTGGSLLKYLIPALLVLGVLGFLGRKGCNTGVDAIDNVAAKTADMTEGAVKGGADMVKDGAGAVGDAAKAGAGAVGDAAKAGADMVSGAFSNVNEAGKKALGSIKFAAGSAGSQMMSFIEGGMKGDANFRFKNLTFNTGSAEITAASAVEVDNLGAVLKAYPDVKINVSGYTDNTGDAAKNVALSQARADAVKARMMAKGISGGRIMTKGYGDADPVGDNSTPEGRKQNRRIEVTLAK